MTALDVDTAWDLPAVRDTTWPDHTGMVAVAARLAHVSTVAESVLTWRQVHASNLAKTRAQYPDESTPEFDALVERLGVRPFEVAQRMTERIDAMDAWIAEGRIA